jgi:hypothetical protein
MRRILDNSGSDSGSSSDDDKGVTRGLPAKISIDHGMLSKVVGEELKKKN